METGIPRYITTDGFPPSDEPPSGIPSWSIDIRDASVKFTLLRFLQQYIKFSCRSTCRIHVYNVFTTSVYVVSCMNMFHYHLHIIVELSPLLYPFNILLSPFFRRSIYWSSSWLYHSPSIQYIQQWSYHIAPSNKLSRYIKSRLSSTRDNKFLFEIFLWRFEGWNALWIPYV